MNLNNIGVHRALAHQFLEMLRQEHIKYVIQEGLDITAEPQKSYFKEYKAKMAKAVNKHKPKI